MILGIDTGIASCGWALLDEQSCTFLDLGVIVQRKEKRHARTLTLERARRANVQAGVIAAKAPGCSMIVCEQMSLGMPGAMAKVAIGMSWGIILGVTAMISPRPKLLTIAPQRWQREVLPSAGKEVDYDELARAAGEHLLQRHPRAAAALQRIPEKDRQHAIDAAMIALCGALRPQRCDVVGESSAA